MILLLLALLSPDDWPAFRGPSGDGRSAEKPAPVEWAPDRNVAWKTPLAQPGNGSPVVAKGRVFIAGTEDKDGLRRSLACLDRKDGKVLWTRTVDFGRALKTHQTNFHSSSTPVVAGDRVLVWHGSPGLFCYDLDGKELWKAAPGEVVHMWGDGASPVVHQGRVLLNVGPGKGNALAAFDLASGKPLWRTEEPYTGDGDTNERKKYLGSWATPVVAKVDGKDQVLVSMPTRLVAYDPADGKILWWSDGINHDNGDLAYSSPTVVGDTVVAVGGFGGPMMGVRLGGGKGDVTSTHRLWRFEKRPQSIGSGIAVGDHLYLPQAGPARVDCIDPKTGKATWEHRVDGTAFWSSLVQAGGRLYGTTQKGSTVVLVPNPAKPEILAVNELKEACNATPAISDGEVFIRTHRHLWCIAAK